MSEALKKRAEKAEITAEDVLRGLYAEATYVGDGASHAARVSAWAHLGKHFGLFAEQSAGQRDNRSAHQMTDDELLEIARLAGREDEFDRYVARPGNGAAPGSRIGPKTPPGTR